MIEKMKYINVTGSLENMDDVIERQLSRYDIQLEYAAKELNISPYTGHNPFTDSLPKAETLIKLTGTASLARYPVSAKKAQRMVEEAYAAYEKRGHIISEMESQLHTISQYIDNLQHFTSLDVELYAIDSFSYIHYRYGKLPLENFLQFNKFLQDESEIVFIKSHRDTAFVWGVYFTPMAVREKTDTIFASLHFENIPISGTCLGESISGTPAAIIHFWRERLADIEKRYKALTKETIPFDIHPLSTACQKVIDSFHLHEMKKYAAVTRNEFIFTGWMTESDAREMKMSVDPSITFITRDAENTPTRLKNPPLFRFFETFTRMYGLPDYNELDPTIFIAITYTLLFGLMFGDVGQGLCIALIGYAIYQKYQSDLGGVMAVVGLSATFFGFLYGSIFGLEHILPALWMRPHDNINATLFFAVGLGVGVILISMGLHMVNAYRQKNWGDLFFNPNGIAGLCFYTTVLLWITKGRGYGGIFIILIILPLLLIAFKEPLIKFISGERKLIEGSVGLFLFQSALTLMETLLAYATNTVSFVRVGAFAISHAGMMSVVLLLSRSAAGTNNVLIFILGNIVVMGIEGLLVGIQVLRLDFYEMFSRFYKGGGKTFNAVGRAS